MIQNKVESWANIINKIQTRWRWVGYALSIAALIYLGGLLIYTGVQVKDFNPAAYWRACLTALGLYLVSLLLQFIVWARLLSSHHKISWQDMAIYSQSILLRRLPGGIWHWLGRSALYSGTTKVSGRVVMLANFTEWAMLLLVAGGIFFAGLTDISPVLRWLLTVLLIGLALILATAWQTTNKAVPKRLTEGVLWVAFYGLSWVMGGLITWAFVQSAGGEQLDWITSTWIWAVTGGSSLLIVFIPAGLGVREITLTWLLRPYLPPSGALIIGVLIRLTFILADILWGSLGWGLSRWLLHHPNRRSKSA